MALAALAGCETTRTGDIASYCADSETSADPLCELRVDVQGQSTALSDMDISLEAARAVADSAMTAAEAADAKADEAMTMASQISLKDQLSCTTRTLNKTDTGTCQAGETLMSCTQTRYTTRAGGLSFLREIDDEKCRYNSRVLEIQARCCTLADENGA